MYAFLLVLLGAQALLSEAQAMLRPCDVVILESTAQNDPPVTLTSKTSKLSLKDAKKIVGTARFGENAKLVKRALDYIKKQTYPSADDVIADLDILFQAVKARGYDWDFEGFRAQDGAIGFVGTVGHALILRENGELFKGRIDRRLYNPERTARLIDYSKLESIGHVKIQPPAPATTPEP